jgi:Tfp pilus assembly protein PilP
MATAGAGAQPPLEPCLRSNQQEVFTYDPGDSPDPFKPRSLKAGQSGGAFQPDLSRPKGPLEQFPLDGLRMVGTISKDRAAVRAGSYPGNARCIGSRRGITWDSISAWSSTSTDVEHRTQGNRPGWRWRLD